MDTLTKKTLDVPRGLTYTYYTSPAAAGKPTILLLHGFPDEALEWEDLIVSHLAPAGYGVIAPDCLGYGGTSKPTDPAQYKWGLMADDMTRILDAENIAKAVVMGHDFGSAFAQRVYNLRPDRVSGLGMFNVSYSAPEKKAFDLDGFLARTEQLFGHGCFWYWKLFAAKDGAEVLGKNLDSTFDMLHVPGEEWLPTLCTPDGLRNWCEEGKRGQTLPYATEEMRKHFVERMARDGFEAPLCWYKATVFGHQISEADESNKVVKVPTLFVGYTRDYVCRKDLIKFSADAGLLPHLTNVTLEGSHWGMLEHSKEFGEAVVGWLDQNHSASKL